MTSQCRNGGDSVGTLYMVVLGEVAFHYMVVLGEVAFRYDNVNIQQ